MRFLRFQAPWAYGNMFFVLLSQHAGREVGECVLSTLDVAEKRHVRDASRRAGRPNTNNERVEDAFFLHDE